MSKDNENKEPDYEDLGQKMGDFIGSTFKDMAKYMKEEKVYEGESFFDLFEKHSPDFKNPLKEKSKFKETIEKFQEKIKTMNVTDVKQTSLIRNDENSFTVEVLVPGFVKSEISVEVVGNSLNIKALHADYGVDSAWKRDIEVSYVFDEDEVDFKSITSKHELGILTIVIPKKEKEEREETIKVEIS